MFAHGMTSMIRNVLGLSSGDGAEPFVQPSRRFSLVMSTTWRTRETSALTFAASAWIRAE